jgi:NAD(P)H-binding
LEPMLGSGGSNIFDRRNVLKSAAVSALSAAWLASTTAPAACWAAEGIGSSPDSPIVVLGAGGKVGKLCSQILAQKGLYTRAVTRSGSPVLSQDSSKFVSYVAGDVTKPDTLAQALQGASGVIFAASASGAKRGGDPAHVDYLGAYNTAQACLQAKVPKLVLISAGTVTRPDSAGFKATNFFVKYVYGDRIMDYKSAGEAAMRDLYKDAPPGVAYAVIRPGGLNEKPSVGPSKVHVSQGDVYSSEVTREDVALVSVATLLKGKATDFVTFELNQVEGLGKAQNDLPDLPSELVHAGAPSFDALLDGLLTDAQMQQKYPDIVNSAFRGSGIEPISKLA